MENKLLEVQLLEGSWASDPMNLIMFDLRRVCFRRRFEKHGAGNPPGPEVDSSRAYLFRASMRRVTNSQAGTSTCVPSRSSGFVLHMIFAQGLILAISQDRTLRAKDPGCSGSSLYDFTSFARKFPSGLHERTGTSDTNATARSVSRSAHSIGRNERTLKCRRFGYG